MDYAGVDIIPGEGLQVLEVNGVAAWHGLQRVTPFNIAQRDRRRPDRPQGLPRPRVQPGMTPRDAFLRACALDVQVRKPGNVSLASPGHRMVAQQFLDSAAACRRAAVRTRHAGGRKRVEAAVRASWAGRGLQHQPGHRAAVRTAGRRRRMRPGPA